MKKKQQHPGGGADPWPHGAPLGGAPPGLGSWKRRVSLLPFLRFSLRDYGFCMATLLVFCLGSLFYQLSGGPPRFLLDLRQYLGKEGGRARAAPAARTCAGGGVGRGTPGTCGAATARRRPEPPQVGLPGAGFLPRVGPSAPRRRRCLGGARGRYPGLGTAYLPRLCLSVWGGVQACVFVGVYECVFSGREMWGAERGKHPGPRARGMVSDARPQSREHSGSCGGWGSLLTPLASASSSPRVPLLLVSSVAQRQFSGSVLTLGWLVFRQQRGGRGEPPRPGRGRSGAIRGRGSAWLAVSPTLT